MHNVLSVSVRWVHGRHWIAFVVAMLLFALPLIAPAGRVAADEGKNETDEEFIVLTIDYGDGFERRYSQLEHRPDMTVRDALDLVSKHPHGVPYQARGSGETTFVTSIDGVANEGANGKNWLFRVSDSLAPQSCGITRLEPGDSILWRFQQLD